MKILYTPDRENPKGSPYKEEKQTEMPCNNDSLSSQESLMVEPRVLIQMKWTKLCGLHLFLYGVGSLALALYFGLTFFWNSNGNAYDRNYSIFSEFVLLRVVCCMWLLCLMSAICHLAASKSLPMPLYLIQSTWAFIGTLAILAINLQKVSEGRMRYNSIYMIFIVLLSIFAFVNVLIYIVCAWTERKVEKLAIPAAIYVTVENVETTPTKMSRWV